MAEETKEQLAAMAAELGIAVTSEQGGKEPTKADYRAAIDAYKAQQPDATPIEEEGTHTYKVTGPYAVFGKRNGETFDAEVKAHDETGAQIIVVGSEWAVLQPLLDAGWITREEG